MRHVLVLDATALHSLEEVYAHVTARGITLVLSGVTALPLMLMVRSGFLDRIGKKTSTATSSTPSTVRAKSWPPPPPSNPAPKPKQTAPPPRGCFVFNPYLNLLPPKSLKPHPAQTTFSRDFSENSQLFSTTFAFSCRFYTSFNRRERSIVLTSGTRHDRAFSRTTPRLCCYKRSRLRCQTHWVLK